MSCLTCVALSTGVKRSVSVRRAETPVCPWRGCVLSAALTAASAPTRTPPTHSTPALLPHRARGPTGGWSHVDGCPDNTEVTLQSSLMLMSGCCFFLPLLQHVWGRQPRERLWHSGRFAHWHLSLTARQRTLSFPWQRQSQPPPTFGFGGGSAASPCGAGQESPWRQDNGGSTNEGPEQQQQSGDGGACPENRSVWSRVHWYQCCWAFCLLY